MQKRALIIFLVLINFSVQAQVAVVPKKGEKEWSEIRTRIGIRHYEQTLEQLKAFAAKYPDFIPAQKLLAESYLYTYRFQEAAAHIEAILGKYPVPDKDWLVMQAEAYHQLRQYPEAIAALKRLKDWPNLGLPYQRQVQERIDRLEYAFHAISNPVPYHPENLDTGINTAAFELYPYISPEGDRLFFTRKEKHEDLYVAEYIDSQWVEAKPLPVNTTDNEGAQTVSADGKFLFFTACNRPSGLGSCDIFYAVRTPQGWTQPQGIGAPINSTDWESQPNMSANGMALLFSSNRPNGIGGKDIYISYLGQDNKWKEPQNLGPVVNTKGDEETPFLHADGRTLYFSSDGHPSVGGKDIYMTRLSEEGTWSEPVNLGYPINTEGDESSLYVALDGKTAYLSTDRPGGYGHLDIYRFELNEAVRAIPATYVKAVVKDAVSGQLLDSRYKISELADDRLFAAGRTAGDGAFLICMPADKTFRLQVEKQGYAFYSDQFRPQPATIQHPYVLEVLLQPLSQGATVVLKNVRFATDSYVLDSVSYPELDEVVTLLKRHPEMQAEIAGHTDNTGQATYNMELSGKRAESVVNYLVSKGVAANRLKAKGYGAAQPVAANDTEEGRSLNRRTELILKAQ